MARENQTNKQTKFHRYLSQGAKEGALIAMVAICVYLFMAFISYDPGDPGWATTGHAQRANNYAGRSGAWFADIFTYFFGYVSYFLPLFLAFQCWVLFRHRNEKIEIHWPLILLRTVGFLLVTVTSTGFLGLYSVAGLGDTSGGVLGRELAAALVPAFNLLGSTLILVSLFLFGITVLTGLSWIRLMDAVGNTCLRWFYRLSGRLRALVSGRANKRSTDDGAAPAVASPQKPASKAKSSLPVPPVLTERVPLIKSKAKSNAQDSDSVDQNNVASTAAETSGILDKLKKSLSIKKSDKASALLKRKEPSVDDDPRMQDEALSGSAGKSVKIEPFKVKNKSDSKKKEVQPSLFEFRDGPLPPVEILDPPEMNKKRGYSKEALEQMSRLLEVKLLDFGVIAEVVAVNPGPVITRFEIQPAAGVKVAKIVGLAKDLARSLAVMSVRVVEVIPGKSVVGIEIPNEIREIVRLSEVLFTDEFQNAESPLTMGLGNDISGDAVVTNLSKMPHLLVAGTTGSGKSVGVNAMIVSILFKATPEEVRFIMVDPKMLELSIYEGIPHLLTPVVTDMKDAANALRWCVAEMERRYKLMAHMGVRNIAGFNRKVKDAAASGEPLLDPLWNPHDVLDNDESDRPELVTLPFIVVVIDEFADMMMIVGKKVEELIARIAQKARAAGIHLILATQRPSVDVITGLIKANIPTRMSFQVSSRIDSRTILDQGGAEQLLGHGDMLYLPPGTSLPERVHGAFVSDDEVHRIVKDWRKRGEPAYLDDVLTGGDIDSVPGISPEGGAGDNENDALFDEAVAFVTESRKASISAVQRKLKIGYNRAANLVESMEAAGVVSQAGHNGAREVLAPPPPRA